MKVLVIWAEIPERERLLQLFVDARIADKLKSYHGHYINSTNAADDMNDFFYTDEGNFKFAESEVQGPLVNATYDLIVQCGFLL